MGARGRVGGRSPRGGPPSPAPSRLSARSLSEPCCWSAAESPRRSPAASPSVSAGPRPAPPGPRRRVCVRGGKVHCPGRREGEPGSSPRPPRAQPLPSCAADPLGLSLVLGSTASFGARPGSGRCGGPSGVVLRASSPQRLLESVLVFWCAHKREKRVLFQSRRAEVRQQGVCRGASLPGETFPGDLAPGGRQQGQALLPFVESFLQFPCPHGSPSPCLCAHLPFYKDTSGIGFGGHLLPAGFISYYYTCNAPVSR